MEQPDQPSLFPQRILRIRSWVPSGEVVPVGCQSEPEIVYAEGSTWIFKRASPSPGFEVVAESLAWILGRALGANIRDGPGPVPTGVRCPDGWRA